MKRKIILLSILVSGMMVATGVLFLQGSGTSAAANGFGFEKNIEVRKGADADSVAGCMQSCENMLAGWLEMNPNSPNYTRQGEKIEAKAQQCLGMNELAGFPFSEEEILASCGLGPSCVEVDPREISFGACTDISSIEGLGLSQCCGIEGPQGGINCGAEEEWVVGVAAFPVCYIPGS